MRAANCRNLRQVASRGFLTILFTAAVAVTARAQSDVEEALAGSINPSTTTIYTAKSVITMDPKNARATAIAVRGDRIVAVGSLDSVCLSLASAAVASLMIPVKTE